jgi:hypothetical protein
VKVASSKELDAARLAPLQPKDSVPLSFSLARRVAVSAKRHRRVAAGLVFRRAGSLCGISLTEFSFTGR